MKEEQRQRLRTSLDSLRGKFDVVFIDTHPDLSYLTTSALIAADWMLVPVFPSGYDLDGLNKLKVMRAKVQERYNPGLNFLGVLLGRYDMRTKLDDDIYQMLCSQFSEKVFSTRISGSVRHREAPLYGLSVLEHAPTDQAAEQFRRLTQEVLQRLLRAERTAGEGHPPHLQLAEANS